MFGLSIIHILYIPLTTRFHAFSLNEILYLYSTLNRLKNRRYNAVYFLDADDIIYVSIAYCMRVYCMPEYISCEILQYKGILL